MGIDGAESLPLGVVPSAILLVAFTCIKSSISLLLAAAKDGEGFPFLFETLLFFPFAMQAIFYTVQTCWMLNIMPGLSAIRAAAASMAPCAFYSGFVTSTTLLETYSLQFIPPSTFVILKQLTMVVIAIGEVVFFTARPSRSSWFLIFCQAFCVGLFQYSASSEASSKSDAAGESVSIGAAAPIDHFATGVTACLASVATGGFGAIMQQRFMQKQARAVPVSVKLFYQHIFEFVLVIVILLLRSANRSRLWSEGFFSGWNHWAAIVTVTMWFSFLFASAVSAYISALAGAFAVAVSVALTGALEFSLFGRTFSKEQFTLMGMVCFIAMLYTKERLATLAVEEDKLEKPKSVTPRKISKTENGWTHTGDEQELQHLCEEADDVPLYHMTASTRQHAS